MWQYLCQPRRACRQTAAPRPRSSSPRPRRRLGRSVTPGSPTRIGGLGDAYNSGFGRRPRRRVLFVETPSCAAAASTATGASARAAHRWCGRVVATTWTAVGSERPWPSRVEIGAMRTRPGPISARWSRPPTSRSEPSDSARASHRRSVCTQRARRSDAHRLGGPGRTAGEAVVPRPPEFRPAVRT